jgi:hypothetical protein
VSDNIWCTIECDAWSRNFCYVEYLKLFEKASDNITCDPVSIKVYMALCKAFDISLEESCALSSSYLEE